MYTMHSQEFARLVNRQFINTSANQHHLIEKTDRFKAQTKTWSHASFNILQFNSSFKDDLQVVNFQDFNHTSFHFQLRGRSDANISCFRQALPLAQGQYHVMNCVEPISNFAFPKQNDYSYICIGVNPQYFSTLLRTLGSNWEQRATQLERKEPFTLLDKPSYYCQRLSQTLQAITYPSVADSLRDSFVHNKIEELILLSLSNSVTDQGQELHGLHQRDVDLLYDLKSFLDQHFLLSFTLQTLARQVGINEFKLKKGFKALFRFTVFGYIHHLRMQHGFHLIQQREVPFSAIAAVIGYQSDASFVRAFKNYYGYLPGNLGKDTFILA